MKHSIIPSAQLIVQHCKAKKINNIVISPGSRNAPLTIGFSEDPYFSCFSIVDERSAAFFALGISQQRQEPVAVVCTSGSALLNYYPAVAEAFYSHMPLVIISADRPPYKIDLGDGQTIRQDRAYHRHVGYSANLRQDILHSTKRIKKYAPQWLSGTTDELLQHEIERYNNTELNTAINEALTSSLPVHINVPFEEPLYDTVAKPTAAAEVIAEEKSQNVLMDIGPFADIWNASDKKMVLVGVNFPNSVDQAFLDQLAQDPSVIVLTETTSNLNHTRFFQSIDSIIAPIEQSNENDILFEALRPEILLTFGGLVISKKIKAFLRNYTPKHHWHVDRIKANDTFFALTHHFKTDINSFFEEFLKNTASNSSDYFSTWNVRKLLYETKRIKYLAEAPFSDFKAFASIVPSIPDNYQLQLANSSTVRYTQLFDMNTTLRIFCNRGTSGIDGSTSTAVGAAFYDKNPTLLITGDLSFFYDSNGLWNNYLRPDFRIILINNNGGGIFRILPGCDNSKNFENFFETSHQMNAKNLGAQFGFDHLLVETEEALINGLKTFYESSKRPKILEIMTPRLINDKILLGYFDFIS